MRRRFLALAAALGCALAWPASGELPPSSAMTEDFDRLWRAIDEGYAYFDGGRERWRRIRPVWRARAARAKTRAELILALEGAIAELHDDRVSLSEQAGASARRIPGETDAWAEWREGAAVVTAVRAFGDADVGGLRPGHVVTHVDGTPVDRLVRERLRGTGNPGAAARDWALRHVFAGPRAGSVRLSVRAGRDTATIVVERSAAAPAPGSPVAARRIGPDRDLGYIRVRNGMANTRAEFDAALDELADTHALLVDLRETGDGLPRSATEAILSRFVDRPTPWQVRETSARERMTDRVAAGKEPRYRAPVIVLVDRWTAGEGEALAAGLEAVAQATLVGTPMAGLRGEPGEVRLPHSGLVLRLPVEKAFHVNGTPREALRPAIEVDLAAPSGGPGDPILYQALKRAEQKRVAAPSPAPAGRTSPR